MSTGFRVMKHVHLKDVLENTVGMHATRDLAGKLPRAAEHKRYHAKGHPNSATLLIPLLVSLRWYQRCCSSRLG